MKNNWYRTAAPFGTDPFGGSELSDKTRYSPWGNAGGDTHNGIFSPSDGNHHPNDYFSEGDHTPTLEKRLQKEKEEKRKKRSWYKKRPKKKINKNKEASKIVMAQWGSSGPKMPFWNNESWITETYKDIVGEDVSDSVKNTDKPSVNNYSSQSNPNESQNNIKEALNMSVTIEASNANGKEIGTGFFIGYNIILTCSHVAVPNNQIKNTKISVKVGGQTYNAYVWAYDPNLDAAVVVINDSNYKNEKFFNLSNSSEVQIGEEIFVIGTPLGYENVVGTGIVSSAPIDYREGDQNTPYMFVSTNILPGNSGGPVILKSNLSVIGIVAALIGEKSSQGGNGLSAIIPIDKVKDFLNNNGIKFSFQK